jgi:tripartite motif-containing protein 36
MNNKVEFKLKLLLNSHTLRVISIKSLSDSKKVLSFNSNFCDTRKVQAFCSDISQITKIPLLGVPIQKNTKIHKVFFCEIAIGQSLYVTKEYAESLDVPKNYGSFIISDDNSKDFLWENECDVSNLFYLIKNENKILPLYEIVFEYDEKLEKMSKNSFVCHKCMENPSIMFCPSERASFCQSCDEEIHRDEFLRRHERLYFSETGQKKFICCSKHNTKVVQYFCMNCIEPLCSECKITGDHSAVETIDHKIIPFLDACSTFKTKLIECTDPLNKMVGMCDKELCKFKENVKSFKDNLSSIRSHLEKEFKTLMNQLDSIENNQKQILNAKYSDRFVKSENLKRTEEFANSLDPADLLSNFKSILDLSKYESNFNFDKYIPEQIQCNGSISLKLLKETDSKVTLTDSKDKSVRWRIETLHMAKDQEDNNLNSFFN